MQGVRIQLFSSATRTGLNLVGFITKLSFCRQNAVSSSFTFPSESSEMNIKIKTYYAKNHQSVMGVEFNVIRVLLTYNAEVCKLQKLKSICLRWQIEVRVMLDTNSMPVYKHSKCSDKGRVTSSNFCYSNNPCMNASIVC